MDDLISRQVAIDAFNTNIDELVVSGKENADAVERYINRVIDAIKQLPPTQPTPDQNGDIWITVPDIDKVTRIFVQESKSKFCRIFYEEQVQPEPIKGHWIQKSQALDTVRGYWATCSSCGRGSFGGGNFCRECGSDNRKEKEK